MKALESLGGVAIVVLILLSIVAWGFFLSRIRAGVESPAYEPRRRVPWGMLDIGLTLLLLVVIQSLAGLVLASLVEIPAGVALRDLPLATQAAVLLASSLAMLLGVVVAVAVIGWRTRCNHLDLGVGLRSWRRDMTIGCVAFVMVTVPVYLTQFLLVEVMKQRSAHPLLNLVKDEPRTWYIAVTVFAAVVVAPIAEELLFRVLLQGWLENFARFRGDPISLLVGRPRQSDRRGMLREQSSGNAKQADPVYSDVVDATVDEQNPYRPPANTSTRHVSADSPEDDDEDAPAPAYWPMCVSAFLFAIVHLEHGTDPIPLLILGLGLGFVYRQTHRLWPCVIVHFLFNGMSLAYFLLDLASSRS